MLEGYIALVKKYSKQLVCSIIALTVYLVFPCGIDAANKDYFDENGYLEVLYNLNNGLDTDTTTGVAQTSDGFIWIGSYSGLTRFDGSEFKRVSSELSGITSVTSLYVDSKDQLWIGTNDNGVAVYKKNRYDFWNVTKGLSSNTVRSIAENDEGLIFVATTRGLNIIDDKKPSIVQDVRLKQNYIHELVKARDNRIVGITKKGELFIYKGKTLESFFTTEQLPLKNTNAITADLKEQDVYWIGNASNAIAKIFIKNNRVEVKNIINTGDKRGINGLYQLENNVLLVATDSGVGYVDKNNAFKAFTSLKFNKSVDNILLDYEDNIWLTSSRQGIAKLTGNRFRNIYAIADLSPAVTNAVLEYKGDIYIGSDIGLAVLHNGKPIADHPLAAELRNARVRHLMVDSKDNLWASTYSSKGLIKYSPDEGITKFNLSSGMLSDRVRVALESKNGIIYVGTRDGLSLIRDGKVIKNFTMQDGLGNSQVLCLLENGNRIYAGTDGGGITVLENETIVDTIDEKDGLKNDVILRMTMDPNGKTLWISTSTSIAYYEDGKITIIKDFPGINNFDIIFIPDNKMLVTCNRGIYVTSSERLKKGKFSQLLTRREGLNGSLTANSFNYFDKQGNLYICQQAGLDRINIADIFKSDVKMKLAIPSVKLDGVDYYFDDQNTLKVSNTVDTISFRGYIVSNKLDDAFISIMLEGHDKKARTFSRFANQDCVYSNLPGGKYTIRIGIYDPQTGKLAKEESYYIIKEHRLTEHTEVIGLLLLLGVVGSFMLYRSSVGKRIKALITKQKETERLLDEIIDAFAKAIDLKDHYTSGHSDRVAEYSKQLALAMGMSTTEAEKIYRIAKLHDVGKVIVPYDILNKPGRLTEAELETMKKHTESGYEILSAIKSFPRIAIGARTHHERMDGKGYGKGLSGKDIPIEGRIIAVADTFDAMNSTRIYRPHLSRERIIEELERAKDTQLDGKIVNILLKLIANGSIVIEENDTPLA